MPFVTKKARQPLLLLANLLVLIWLCNFGGTGWAYSPPASSSQAFTPESSPPAPVPTTLEFPAGFMKSIKDYGAVGNGVTDDTAAIQAALNENRRDANGNYLYPSPDDANGRPKALYFPAGTYLVSNTVDWAGCCVTLQGQGSTVSIIKLKDNASGFNNSAAPKPVVRTEKTNEAFRHYIWNLGINTGNGNAGAIGLDYIASNTGSLRDVAIKSGDGTGYAGLGMDRNWPGPLLIKDVSIDGFDYGIRVTAGEYSQTYENITLTNQRIAGIRNFYGILVMRNLRSTNSVPVLQGDHPVGQVTIIDGELNGGANTVSALQTPGELYLRNVRATGYQSLVKYGSTVVPGLIQSEYATNRYELFSGSAALGALKLPVKETPEYHDNNLANWAKFTTPNGYGDTSQLQPVLNSGKPTVYFPFAAYLFFNERVVTVPATVKRIVGFSAVINSDARGTNGGGIKFVIEADSPDPLIIEGFGYGVKIEHRSPRTLVIKNGAYRHTDGPGAGELFLEDVIIAPLTLNYTKKVWARQFNPDSLQAPRPKVENRSADLWILGIKTEDKGTLLHSFRGSRTELLGGMILVNNPLVEAERQKPIFICEEARCSLTYRYATYNNQDYYTQVQETRNGETRKLATNAVRDQIALFVGYSPPVASASPASAATFSFEAKQGQTSTGKSLSVSNSGSVNHGGDLRLNSPQLTGSGAGVFSITPNAAATLQPGNSTGYTLKCTPTAATTYSATLNIATNDPARPTLSYSLSCTGLPLLPDYTSSPNSGTTLRLYGQTGANLSQSLIIGNNGDPGSSLIVSAMQITGTNAGQFTLNPSGAFALGHWQTRQLTIGCITPATPGQSYTASLKLTTNDSGQPSVSYNLLCTGLSPVVVTKTSDNGGGAAQTLSGALQNYTAGQIITFALEGGGNAISITGNLPPVPAGAYLDGGACGTAGIILEGSGTGSGVIGLRLNGGATVRNLTVRNFAGVQVQIKSNQSAPARVFGECLSAKSR
jgi:hypothetical protein